MSTMPSSDLVMYAEDYEKIKVLIEKLRKDANARVANRPKTMGWPISTYQRCWGSTAPRSSLSAVASLEESGRAADDETRRKFASPT